MNLLATSADHSLTETLDIVYRDEVLIAVHKPAGLLVHRSEIDRHETRFALQIVRDQIGQYVHPLHRLDKPTSGILLLALQKEVAQAMMRQFAEQQVEKKYLALVRGYVPEHDLIDHALGRIEDDYEDRSSDEKQAAQTAYRRLQRFELPVEIERYPASRFSLLEAQPHTGRQHQIRRHLKHISHPIIGDVRYGRGAYNRYFREHFACQRLMLACVAMRFQHPLTNQPLQLVCPPAADFSASLAALQAYALD